VPGGPIEPKGAEVHHHRDVRSGGARAAVFGVSDGLVTNVSLILGVAGAHPGGSIVRLTGVAGLVAGAFSMAAGEYLSMQAQRELLQRELEVERQSLRRAPEAERRELTAIYERRGLDPGLAAELVDEVMRDPDVALETHAREELGIDPGSLGSPWRAAVSSFVTFAVGALLPLLPAKQRVTDPNDWMSTDAEVACPDPNCPTRFRITRTGRRYFRRCETTAVRLPGQDSP